MSKIKKFHVLIYRILDWACRKGIYKPLPVNRVCQNISTRKRYEGIRLSKALEIAAERYAKGEISKVEFEEIRSSLLPSESNDTKAQSSTVTTQPAPVVATATPERPRVQPPPSSILPTSFYDISSLHTALNYLMKGCAGISAFSAFSILRQSGIQNKYDQVYLLENNGFVLAVTVLPLLAAVCLFLFWKKKSTDNLFMLRGPQSVTPAGAIYWYFVPIAWFWKPYEAMRNLAVGFNLKSDEHWLLPTWWGLWWGSFAVAIIAGITAAAGITTAQQANTYVTWSVILYIAEALSFVAAWGILDAVSKAQQEAIRMEDSA